VLLRDAIENCDVLVRRATSSGLVGHVFAQQIQAGVGGKRQQRLGNVGELAVLQLGQLVGYDVAEGSSFTDWRQLPDAGGREGSEGAPFVP